MSLCSLSVSDRTCLQLFMKYQYAPLFSQLPFPLFLQISIIYALYDTVYEMATNGETVQSMLRVERFERLFWKSYEEEFGRYEDHPILPALINLCVSKLYPPELFHRFFMAMSDDANRISYTTYDEALAYLQNTSGLFGEFVVSMVCPTTQYINEARALGMACHVTYLATHAQKRVYLPKHFIHEIIRLADSWYKRAEEGITYLPISTQTTFSILFRLYNQIHNEIQQTFTITKQPRLSAFQTLQIVRRYYTCNRILRLGGYYLLFHCLRNV